jgi:hypothetical protein
MYKIFRWSANQLSKGLNKRNAHLTIALKTNSKVKVNV